MKSSKNFNDSLRFSDVRLGVVCPMANESMTATAFVNAVLEQCNSRGFKAVTFFAILDQATKDNTRELLENLQKTESRLEVVWAPENRGVVDAYLRGYREAIQSGCDWILEIDSGFSHQPSDIPKFFNRMIEGHDCVFGSRFCEGGEISESPVKRYILSRGGTILANTLLGTKLSDMTSGFEMFSRPALENVLNRGIQSRGPFFQTEIKAYCRHLQISEVPIHYRAASHNISNKVIKDSFSNLWRLFRLRMQGAL
ncbi:MAG TPA: glycosyltransferase [Pyrinomonadaceae bacterium]|jgi:dolichol-phosphate mannosyltransferase